MLVIRVREHLTLEAYYDRLFRTVDFDAYLHNVTHGHQFPAEDVDGLVNIVGKLLGGEMAFVVQSSWIPVLGSFCLVDRAELQANWRKYTRGCRTKIVDGTGVYSPKAFLERIKK